MADLLLLPGVLTRSNAASILILAVLLARFLLTKAPKRVRIWLWALVAVRLLVPVLPESPWSLVPMEITAPGYQEMVPAETAVPDNIVISDDVTVHYQIVEPEIEIRSFDWTWPWLIGVALMLGYVLFS